MEIAETAVAHEHDDVPGAKPGEEMIDDVVDLRQIEGGSSLSTHVLDDALGRDGAILARSLRSGNFGDDEVVGLGKGSKVSLLEDRPGIGGAGRLKENPEAGVGIGLTQALKGLFDGGGMVGEVVDEGDTADLADQFLSAFYSFKGP